jgi:hypothetical protein
MTHLLPKLYPYQFPLGVCTVCTDFSNSTGERQPAFLAPCCIFTMFGRIGGQTLRCAVRRPVSRRLRDRKCFASSANGSATAPSTSSPLGAITIELDRVAPRFEVPASQITILDSPANFYTALKVHSAILWPCDAPANLRLRRTKFATPVAASISRHCISARRNTSLLRPSIKPCAITRSSKFPS